MVNNRPLKNSNAMKIKIKVPSPGESITEVEIGKWLIEDGTIVHKDQEIAEIESDKATLTVVAEGEGKAGLMADEGQTVAVGAVICIIDTSFASKDNTDAYKRDQENTTLRTLETEKPTAKTEPSDKENPLANEKTGQEQPNPAQSSYDAVKVTPVAKELLKKNNLSVDDVINGLKRLGKREVESVIQSAELHQEPLELHPGIEREQIRQRMSPLRRKLSERLVAVKNETAMLTTFNEIDMSNLVSLRKQFQVKFQDKYGTKLGFVSFFTKAAALALEFHPMVNAQINGDEIVIPKFADIGIAVSTNKGLLVPIIRNAESKSIPSIEQEIKTLADKARDKKISVDELAGGTFTITNGGVFGSLLSTPIINPPQSAILGMHNIVERPVAVEGQVAIRPMMYVALSYDHRIIDGKDSVGFLVKVKEMIENPERIFSGGKEPVTLLLGL
jgi:2-oxoglutarate dehydrogenase E2 component (dihydrolipoamide succinyltransferase)